MDKKYGIVEFKNGKGANTAFSVVDIQLWPKDIDNFLTKHEAWFRHQVLESLKIATFGVTLRQSAQEARRKAQEYAGFMNAQDEAMQLARDTIKLTSY